MAKGTVSVQMRQLKEKGYVTEDVNRHLRLTDSGDNVARQVFYNRSTIIQFLSKVLEVDAAQAEVDACKIEHLLSAETGHQILALVQFLLSDEPTAKALLKKLKNLKLSKNRTRHLNKNATNKTIRRKTQTRKSRTRQVGEQL